MDASQAAWAARFSAVVPTEYHHEFGLEGAYREHADEWGYNLSEEEFDVDVDPSVEPSGVLRGRVFSQVGTVVWHPGQGAIVLGW